MRRAAGDRGDGGAAAGRAGGLDGAADVADDAALSDGGDAAVLHDLCMVNAGARLFGDVHGATADDRTTAGASAEFRQSHLNRHYIASHVHAASVVSTCDPMVLSAQSLDDGSTQLTHNLRYLGAVSRSVSRKRG